MHRRRIVDRCRLSLAAPLAWRLRVSVTRVVRWTWARLMRLVSISLSSLARCVARSFFRVKSACMSRVHLRSTVELRSFFPVKNCFVDAGCCRLSLATPLAWRLRVPLTRVVATLLPHARSALVRAAELKLMGSPAVVSCAADPCCAGYTPHRTQRALVVVQELKRLVAATLRVRGGRLRELRS